MVLASLPSSSCFSCFEEPPHCHPSWLLPSSILNLNGGEFPLVHTVSTTYCLWRIWQWPFWLVWGDTSWYFRFPVLTHLAMLTTFRGTYLERCDGNLPVKTGLLKVCPSWTSFSPTSSRTFCEGRCFLLAALRALWIWSAHPLTFASDFMAEKQKATRCLQASCWFVFCCNFIVTVCWSRVHCVVLFVPVNKNLIQFRLDPSALFRVLFSCEVITVCALAFPVVFGRSFWLLHLISVKVKRFLPNS